MMPPGSDREPQRQSRVGTANIDRAEILAGFISESSLYRATHPGVVGVRYGSSQDENLDIFLPSSSTGRAPVHIFNHGGFRYQFGSHEWSFVAAPLTAAGAIVVMPRYWMWAAG